MNKGEREPREAARSRKSQDRVEAKQACHFWAPRGRRHERLAAGFCGTPPPPPGAVGIMRAGDRAERVEIGRGRLLDVVEGDLGDVIGPLVHLLHGSADGDAPAVAACESHLVVALVDVIGDVARFGALEFGGGDAVLGDFADHRVELGLDLFEA